MATIDIGKIKPVFKGAYNNSTAYVLDDIVYYNGSSYCKAINDRKCTTNGTYWNVLASGSGGIWDSNLSLGTAGKILQVNSGATALEFTDAPAGGVVQTKFYTDGTLAATNTSYADLGSFSLYNYTNKCK